jgi:hypothetical protein
VGELTRQGKSQQYLLGRTLYQIYWKDLFGPLDRYLPHKFHFRSTNANRTIESLQAQLLGLFENLQPLRID